MFFSRNQGTNVNVTFHVTFHVNFVMTKNDLYIVYENNMLTKL